MIINRKVCTFAADLTENILGKFAAFKLPLKGMPVGVQTFEYHLGGAFFRDMESADVLHGDVDVNLSVKCTGDAYELNFKLTGSIYVACDRCLDEMELPVDTTYHLTVKYGDEYNDESDDVLVIPESDSYLNVAYMLYDTVALTIPLKHVHPVGKCNKKMSSVLKKHAVDDEEGGEATYGEYGDDENENENNNNDDDSTDPRWDALKQLNDNN